jgi:NitT/TauT family transport system permease protein
VQPLAQFWLHFGERALSFVVVGIFSPSARHLAVATDRAWRSGTSSSTIAGASVFERPERNRRSYTSQKAQWWRRVILRDLSYYVTGALTASGGSWNASIVAEVASWGDTKLEAHGLGAYIAKATADGDFHRVVLGVGVMSLFVVVVNRALWRRLYAVADRRLRND